MRNKTMLVLHNSLVTSPTGHITIESVNVFDKAIFLQCMDCLAGTYTLFTINNNILALTVFLDFIQYCINVFMWHIECAGYMSATEFTRGTHIENQGRIFFS